MSRPRRRRVVTLLDEDGRREQHVSVLKELPALAATVPPAGWLVEVYDPARHLVAVLTANAGLDPLVYSVATGAPSFVLTPDGLAGALVSTDTSTGQATVTPVGTARDEFGVFCSTCRLEFALPAQALRAKRGPKPGRPGRLVLGVSHTV